MSRNNIRITKQMNNNIKKYKRISLLQLAVMLIYLLIILVVCGVIFAVDIDTSQSNIIFILSVFVSAFFGGFLSGKISRKNGLLNGIVYDILPILILIVSSMTINNFEFDYKLPVTLLISVVLSALGGICAVNTRKK